MADVSMTYSALESAAGKINTAKEDLENVISQLDGAVNALEGNWTGKAYEAFRNAWTESKPTMQKLAMAVGNFAPELNSAVSDESEREAQRASTMSNLAF